ncbi:uridine phosphorylase 1-like [Tropilaelaps mercedesae]|uniref:Uridine phosphorylase 1-like n=1 Tax=Tropilaelaps mercedesae TaxID=418985 RepID=A0A1V9XV37_9ACAR|nr:uridine phosphorylase 1-like [Tropilaelaps mercedesae]
MIHDARIGRLECISPLHRSLARSLARSPASNGNPSWLIDLLSIQRKERWSSVDTAVTSVKSLRSAFLCGRTTFNWALSLPSQITMSGVGCKVILRNPHLADMDDDILYHLGLSRSSNLKRLFEDVRFVCMGGTPARMEAFARYMKQELGIELPSGADLYDITGHGERYTMFKVGPVLSVSHGMGAPSASILLHETIKLLSYAECTDVVIIRIGTSGGIGVSPGTVVVSTNILTGLLEENHEFYVLGKVVKRPSRLDQDLANDIVSAASQLYPASEVMLGKTMCANDFYEAQMRLDGAICEYSSDEKFAFLRKLRDMGVLNIEMESSVFAAMCTYAGVKCAVVCVTLVDRLSTDQISASRATLSAWQDRPQKAVAAYIKHKLGMA